MTKKYIIKCYIPVEVEEPELYDLNEVDEIMDNLRYMHPENIYEMERVEEEEVEYK